MSRSAVAQPWNISGGVTQFTRHQAQSFARQLLQSQTYRDWVEERLTKHTMPVQIEMMLWHYAYGKPIEQVNVMVQPGQEDLSTLTLDELQERATKLSDLMGEAKQLNDALPAQFRVVA